MGPDLKYADYVAEPDGIGFRQRDLSRVAAPQDYQAYYQAIDHNVKVLSEARLRVLEAFVGNGDGRSLLDFGCGTGRFASAADDSWDAYGYDLVQPVNKDVTFVTEAEAFRSAWDVVTFFDSLEHLADPATTIRRLGASVVMVSVPWCHRPQDAEWFMAWKHRRPGVHLWHWNHNTLNRLFARCGYRLLMMSSFEDAYRPHPEQPEPNILSAIFQKR